MSVLEKGTPALTALRVGFAMTGSFCTFEKTLAAMEELRRLEVELTPILSYHAGSLDTRFGSAAHFRTRITEICGKPPLDTIPQVEPIGPKKWFDLLIVAPCTGNTLAKIDLGITDTPVTMAVKSHLRTERPVVLAPSTNDGLSASAAHIGSLLNRKCVYFVPFGQDAPDAKPRSLVADLTLLPETMEAALQGSQLQPILLRA